MLEASDIPFEIERFRASDDDKIKESELRELKKTVKELLTEILKVEWQRDGNIWVAGKNNQRIELSQSKNNVWVKITDYDSWLESALYHFDSMEFFESQKEEIFWKAGM